MAYVYRYAGMLEQSANECNTALALDPGNYTFRSCAWAFMEYGKDGSGRRFHSSGRGLRMGCLRHAVAAVARRQDRGGPRSGETYADRASLSSRSAGGLPGVAASFEDWTASRRRPKPALRLSPIPNFCTTRERSSPYCGKNQAALHLLQGAIEQNYCSYSNLQLDPMLAKVRLTPGFDKLLTSAQECQKAINAPNSELPGP